MLNHALDEAQVSITRLDNFLAENRNHLYGELIVEHVRVAHKNDGGITFALLESFIGLLLVLFVSILFFIFVLVLISGLAFRESGFEFAGEANGQGVLSTGGLEFLADLFA